VRDALLGRLGNDLDFTTSAPPLETKKILQKWAESVWDTGIEFGTVAGQRGETTGSHEGFTKPLYNWVPSVAPTELVQLPAGSSWGSWAGQVVMGTLREQSLIFIQLRSKNQVGEVLKVDVGERIRDLEMG
jgi:glucose/arabinose dehydrogenase